MSKRQRSESIEIGAEEAGPGATPMIAQYLEIKSAHPDCLLFYRMGDFYEMFFDDAAVAADALGIALTKRGRHAGADIPMCGVPVHAANDYLETLIRKGFRVAVCEQLEDPAEARRRGSKAVVRRDVTRLVTRGTLTEDSLLDARRYNHLLALARIRGSGRDEYAIAWSDISTGSLFAMAVAEDTLAAEIARLEPGEVLVADTLDAALRERLACDGCAVTELPGARFDSIAAERRLREVFTVASLDGFGAFSRPEVAALGALVGYVELTQVGRLPALLPPRRVEPGRTMIIDPATRASLEIARSLSGDGEAGLIAHIDRTVTGAGARTLGERALAPSTDISLINRRLDAVALFVDTPALRASLRRALRSVPDLARPLSRLSLGRGGPRDLGAVGAALAGALALPDLFADLPGLAPPPEEIAEALAVLAAGPDDLRDRLAATLAPELPLHVRDGGFVAAGFSEALDQARALRDETRKVIAGLQSRYQDETAIRSLKVKHNNVLGYFIEVPTSHGPSLIDVAHGSGFFHRQTLASAMRFSTAELADLEGRIAQAAATAQVIEEGVFKELADATVAAGPALARIGEAVAGLDVAAALAELAVVERYCRPVVCDDTRFVIAGGRHPVVEQARRRARAGSFVANDCVLESDDPGCGGIWLVTGPNMAGKSTFLRQNALIAILAQMGSFVPAQAAEIGIVDRLFSRVGASDDLAGGRSTFMVEMVETAAILNQAGPRAFVILDEIGRGTATFDGLAIAWATLEHLHEVNRCRTLFATHFHELTSLAARLGRLVNMTMRVSDYNGEVVFLHEVVAGAADRSYGIHVARLAGLPQGVLDRAGAVLSALEDNGTAGRTAALVDDLPLFSVAASPRPAPRGLAVAERLQGVVPDEVTPREALGLLYELKTLMQDEA